MSVTSKKRKLIQIAISKENYFILKGLGRAGDSFNDVVTQIRNKIQPLQSDSQVGAREQIATTSTATSTQGDSIE